MIKAIVTIIKCLPLRCFGWWHWRSRRCFGWWRGSSHVFFTAPPHPTTCCSPPATCLTVGGISEDATPLTVVGSSRIIDGSSKIGDMLLTWRDTSTCFIALQWSRRCAHLMEKGLHIFYWWPAHGIHQLERATLLAHAAAGWLSQSCRKWLRGQTQRLRKRKGEEVAGPTWCTAFNNQWESASNRWYVLWESIQNKITRKIIIIYLGGWKTRGIPKGVLGRVLARKAKKGDKLW